MSKHKKQKIEPKTPAEIVDTIIAMRKCGVREIAWDWKDITLGKVKKRTLIKVCRQYGRVYRKWHGFSVRFNI